MRSSEPGFKSQRGILERDGQGLHFENYQLLTTLIMFLSNNFLSEIFQVFHKNHFKVNSESSNVL